MKRKLRAAVLAGVLLVAGWPVFAQERVLSRGQTLYVPVYSHILHGNLDRSGKAEWLLLSAMLSIRNIDPYHPIKIDSVRYYDTDGKLVREYDPKIRTLTPLQSTDVFVELKDTTGGTGANFLVEWSAETEVNPPIVETVHAYAFGTQSIIFRSTSRQIFDSRQ